MEKFLDIQGKELFPGDRCVYHNGSYISVGVFTHVAKSGGTLIFRDDKYNGRRQISIFYTQIQIFKL